MCTNDEFAKSAHLCTLSSALAPAFAHQMGVSWQGDLFACVCVFCSTFSISREVWERFGGREDKVDFFRYVENIPRAIFN